MILDEWSDDDVPNPHRTADDYDVISCKIGFVSIFDIDQIAFDFLMNPFSILFCASILALVGDEDLDILHGVPVVFDHRGVITSDLTGSNGVCRQQKEEYE